MSDAHTKHSYLSYLVLSKYLALKIVLAIHVLSNKMYCFIDRHDSKCISNVLNSDNFYPFVICF